MQKRQVQQKPIWKRKMKKNLSRYNMNLDSANKMPKDNGHCKKCSKTTSFLKKSLPAESESKNYSVLFQHVPL